MANHLEVNDNILEVPYDLMIVRKMKREIFKDCINNIHHLEMVVSISHCNHPFYQPLECIVLRLMYSNSGKFYFI